MTQEDKLKEAKRLYQTANADQKYVLESLFPELKESEDEKIRKRLLELFKEHWSEEWYGLKVKDVIAWLEKQGEQKPTWSEEDENGLGDALWAIQQASTIAKDENDMGNLWYAENWLKSLKERVQPKQEWSMYDETILKTLIDHFEYKKEFNEAEDYDIVLWLKSLRPQNTWKPDGDQLDALYDMIRSFKEESSYTNRDDIANVVDTLLEQLEAL